MLGIVQKIVTEQLDYDIDFERWLPDGDAIQAASVVVAPDDGVLTVPSYQINDSIVKVWLAGGSAGKSYTVSVIAGTVGGRIKEACFGVRMRNC
ncbi:MULTISPECIES: hypothetical protein [Burkholderia]|uniref:Uncharacterized protein n=1 Tax=Burkholderia aenigmatica TaxID=2015348 RepID=A0A6J5JLQ9_9BURK|nr:MULTISPECIES: hypothetical protein [Burkholderia]CAB3972348.1 hypothetical protein BLA3211_06923 [Burkholderia aenigmatica]